MTKKRVKIDDFHIVPATFFFDNPDVLLQLFGDILHIERPNFEFMVAAACAPGIQKGHVCDTHTHSP